MAESSSEYSQTPETALGLTERERSGLFASAVRLLKTRGTIIHPEPNAVHYNEKGEVYTPNPFLQVEIPSDELAAHALPYDKVTLTSEKVEFGNEDPTRMGIEVQRMTIRNIPFAEDQPPAGAVGHETQWVIFGREPDLGIVVEEEDGEVNLYPDEDDKQTWVLKRSASLSVKM